MLAMQTVIQLSIILAIIQKNNWGRPYTKYDNQCQGICERIEGRRLGDFWNRGCKKLKYADAEFDVSFTTRVLINIPTWSDQKIAINELLRVTKKGGIVVLSESFYEPLVLLNSMRQLVNLPPLYEHDFNRYIKKAYLDKFLYENNYKYDCKETSSIYYLGSRFLRELITEFEDYEGYSNPINKDFFQLGKKYSGGGFGIQQLYIIYK